MSCRRFHEAIAGHAAGAELAPAAALHLADCETCAARLALQRRVLTEIDAELERALAVTASPELVTTMTARASAPRPRPMRWQPAAAWIGLVAAAALAAGVYLRAPAPVSPMAPAGVASAAPATALLATRQPSAAPQGMRTPRRAATHRAATAATQRPVPPGTAEPPVIVDRSQIEAIARLRELMTTGALTEKMLPPPHPHETTALAISPLQVPEITVPDVDAVVHLPGSGERQ